ncbi:LysR family transcriptional regulator [Phreatobacter stygius]|uniref:LysR family transcriptional regulator n=1 Tax=Phreatobacter stygius TaxID=1940610 RepID=A0A4D7AV18_9HYPH|nr:LysR family transcriptional regulator [Phreatobacter stygius]QCI63445.1 LysR family transcriptional regulator [Phreatobacter stygius]
MDRAAEMEILVACVDHGGLTAAAERLNLTPSAISKAVTRLEERLGVKLLERTTRRIALTTEGRAFYDSARRIIGEINDAEAGVMENRGRPRGTLRITSGVAFATNLLAPVLGDFTEAYPEVTIELGITDRMVDIVAANLDIGIRTGPVGDDRLVGRRFADVHRVIVASPAYLARRGRPLHPDDLARHTCITPSNAPGLSLWPFRHGGQIRRVEVRGTVTVDDAASLHALALGGLGITRVADTIVAPSIRTGQLVPLLEAQHVAEPVPMHLVFPPGRQRLPKLRVFLDFIQERFGTHRSTL